MPLSLWIPPDSQYGLLAPGEARTNAFQRAVEQALKRYLFEDRDGGDPTTAVPSYNDALRHFDAALRSQPSFGRDRQAAARLWQALLSIDTPPEQPSAGVHERIEGIFCLMLHGVCAALAKQVLRTESADSSDQDDGDDDTDEHNLPGVEYAEAVRVLAEQLRRLAARWLRTLPEHERPASDDWSLMARLLLEPLLTAFEGRFVVYTLDQKRQRDGRPHTEKRIEIAQPELAQRIERLLETLPLSFSPQPLKQPTAYYLDDPGPSDDEADMCIRVDLIGYRQTNRFLRGVHRDIQCPESRPPDFRRYVAAINVQQAVHWRINRPLLDWTRRLIALIKTRPANAVDKSLSEWIKDTLYRPTKGTRKAFKQSAAFLDSPLASRALDDLCPSDPRQEPPAFYLPWKADHRGRIYAETPWLTPQGGDLQRALLEFARGQVLDESGVRALRRHGANLASTKGVKNDLGITGRTRPVVTLEERERWTLDHEAEILASAADPLSEPFWREVADEPMQFLAFCLAYRQWKQHPEAPIHLPVQIDGTCNGIQHIAALTGDQVLAKAVNVLPSADGLPADIYSELAEAALTTLGRLPIPRGQAIHRHGLGLTDAWLAADVDPSAWLDRKTAKRVVMTIPYGARRGAQAGAVLEAIEDKLIEAWGKRAPDKSEFSALLKWKNSSPTRKDFVRRCTKGLFAKARQAAFPKQAEPASISIRMSRPGEKTPKRTHAKPDTEEIWAPERTEWELLRTFGAYVARALVEHLRGALDQSYPKVGEFSDWLGQCAAACAGTGQKKTGETGKDIGLPLLWLTPLGFPVAQDKFISSRTTTSARLGSRSIKLDVQRLTEEVDPQKQRDALLPNLIHSLDATHLMMTLLEAKARGVHDIGSIHDCLLCHPNQAETLARAVRRTFAELYALDGPTGRPKPLSSWYTWMNQVIALRALPNPYAKLVKGAFEHPGKEGERRLDEARDAGEEDAIHARNVLENLRGLAAPERLLLGMLLELVVQYEAPKTPPTLDPPPQAGDLGLAEDRISTYFFS